jgi:hypothetical protein
VTGRAVTTMAVLSRVRLVLLILALMAGILGMHIMSFAPMSGHGVESAPTGSVSGAGSDGSAHTMVSAAGAVHSGHTESVGAPGHSHSGAQQPGSLVNEGCTGDHGCAGMHSMDSSCTPAAKTTSLAAPVPGTGVTVINPPDGAPFRTAALSYRPQSPSPGDLCISRT